MFCNSTAYAVGALALLLPLQSDNEGLNARLQKTLEELACKENQLRCKLNANELQLKEQIVYNVSGCRGGLVGCSMAGTAQPDSMVEARTLHAQCEAYLLYL
jgi:hypothetical protein